MLFGFAVAGPANPVLWAIAGPIALAMMGLAILRLPLLLFWAVPVSMCVFVYLPVLHYELLVLLLAALMVLREIPRLDVRGLRLQPFEWRYVLFMGAIVPGLVNVISLWRYLGGVKFFALGLIGYEVARRGVRWFGREALLWGPAVFGMITSLQLLQRVASSGVPGFKTTALRSMLTELPWAHANGVAVVLSMSIPALWLLIHLTPAHSVRRWVAIGALAGNFVGILLTAARGPFLVAVGYLLIVSIRVRRSLWLTVGVVVAIGLALALTPIGQGFFMRFVDYKAMDGVVFRILTWNMAWERGVHHLPFGVGAGQGLVQNDELLDVDCHNWFLTLMSEVGPLGLALWLWAFSAIVRVGRNLRRRAETHAAGDAMLGVLATGLLNSMYEPTLTANLHHLLYWWLVGSCQGAEDGAPAKTEQVPASTR